MSSMDRDPRGRKPTDKSTPDMRKYWRKKYRERKANRVGIDNEQ